MKHLIPQWHTDEKSEKIALLMGDRKEIMQQELMGIATDGEGAEFRAEHLDAMFNTEKFIDADNYDITIAFVTCDPSGGGNSDLTFACGAFIKRRWVVSYFFFLRVMNKQ